VVDASTVALGPIGALVMAETRDICTDGAGRVWVDNGSGFALSDVTLSPRDIRFIGVGLVESGGGRVDDSQPLGDAALAGRIRVHVALPPVSRDLPLISLRFPRDEHVDLDDFDFANQSVRNVCTSGSLLVVGVTGSGKTTLLSALIDTLDDSNRVVVLEDVSEIRASHPHTVYLATRGVNPDGGGRVDLAQLVRESLRMRPDVIAIGEIRGVEFRDYVLALTSGHRGLSSVHAGSLAEVGARLTALALVSGIPLAAVPTLVPSAIPLVALCERVGQRVVVSAGTVAVENGALRVNPL
jgi:pilus assembly protein CpaF